MTGDFKPSQAWNRITLPQANRDGAVLDMCVRNSPSPWANGFLKSWFVSPKPSNFNILLSRELKNVNSCNDGHLHHLRLGGWSQSLTTMQSNNPTARWCIHNFGCLNVIVLLCDCWGKFSALDDMEVSLGIVICSAHQINGVISQHNVVLGLLSQQQSQLQNRICCDYIYVFSKDCHFILRN